MPTAGTEQFNTDDLPPAMQAYLLEDKVIIKSEISGAMLVPVLTALLAYCTDEMLSKEKVLETESDTANFILGVYLIANRILQDAVADKISEAKENTDENQFI